jgi:hypothetical protein
MLLKPAWKLILLFSGRVSSMSNIYMRDMPLVGVQKRHVCLVNLPTKTADFSLVELLHQLRLRCASCLHSPPDALCVLSTCTLHVQLIFFPAVVLISTFKPKPPSPAALTTSVSGTPSNLVSVHLARSIAFDLCVARASLLLEITSHTLIALHLSSSPLLFTGFACIDALATGTTPALESLAICILQRSRQGNTELGALFGGLGMLTALGQTILAVSPWLSPFPLFPPLHSDSSTPLLTCSRSCLASFTQLLLRVSPKQSFYLLPRSSS